MALRECTIGAMILLRKSIQRIVNNYINDSYEKDLHLNVTCSYSVAIYKL